MIIPARDFAPSIGIGLRRAFFSVRANVNITTPHTSSNQQEEWGAQLQKTQAAAPLAQQKTAKQIGLRSVLLSRLKNMLISRDSRSSGLKNHVASTLIWPGRYIDNHFHTLYVHRPECNTVPSQATPCHINEHPGVTHTAAKDPQIQAALSRLKTLILHDFQVTARVSPETLTERLNNLPAINASPFLVGHFRNNLTVSFKPDAPQTVHAISDGHLTQMERNEFATYRKLTIENLATKTRCDAVDWLCQAARWTQAPTNDNVADRRAFMCIKGMRNLGLDVDDELKRIVVDSVISSRVRRVHHDAPRPIS